MARDTHIIIAFNEEWERYDVIFQKSALNVPTLFQLFQEELQKDPEGYEEYSGKKIWGLDLYTGRVETATISKTVKLELEF